MLHEPCTNSTEKANGKLRWIEIMAKEMESRTVIGSFYAIGTTEFAIAADALKEHGTIRSVIPFALGLLFSYLASEKLWHRARKRENLREEGIIKRNVRV